MSCSPVLDRFTNEPAGGPAAGAAETDQIKQLKILSYYEEPVELTSAFEQENSHTEVVWEVVSGGGAEAYLDILATEHLPDLLIAGNVLFPFFSGYDVFEDLSGPPYYAPSNYSWFPGLNWDRYKLSGGHKLIAAPKDLPAAVTFYRADILEEHGFPTEPEELAVYMEEPEQWLAIAARLKEHNIYIANWPLEPVYLGSQGYGFFQENLKPARDIERYAQLIEIARQVDNRGLASLVNMWDDRGKESMRSGETAMVYMGEWGRELIKQWVPDTADQWRMTRLPFGQYGVSGGSFYAIPKFGENPELAWRFVQFSMELEKPYRDSMAARAWYAKLPVYRPTPVDIRAEELWMGTVTELLQSKLSGREVALEAQIRVETKLSRELQLLRDAVYLP